MIRSVVALARASVGSRMRTSRVAIATKLMTVSVPKTAPIMTSFPISDQEVMVVPVAAFSSSSSTVVDKSNGDEVVVSQTKPQSEQHEHDHDHDHDHDNEDDDDDEMEQEEMFVEAHESFGHGQKEWGGPRRGGRLPEPTRFGDWERKGRCTDF